MPKYPLRGGAVSRLPAHLARSALALGIALALPVGVLHAQEQAAAENADGSTTDQDAPVELDTVQVQGIRASVIWDAAEARLTRNDNDSNVLCLPGRILEHDEAAWKGILETWLNTPYANAPRYNRRNAQLDELA